MMLLGGGAGNRRPTIKQMMARQRSVDGTLESGCQVSSQGCSRVFIVKVLLAVSEYVRGKAIPSIFACNRELVMKWLNDAKVVMMSVSMISVSMMMFIWMLNINDDEHDDEHDDNDSMMMSMMKIMSVNMMMYIRMIMSIKSMITLFSSMIIVIIMIMNSMSMTK